MRSTRRWKSAPNHPWQRPSAVPRPWTPHNNLLHIKASLRVAGIWLVLSIVGSLWLIVATPVVTRCSIEKPSCSRLLSRSFRLPEAGHVAGVIAALRVDVQIGATRRLDLHAEVAVARTAAFAA